MDLSTAKSWLSHFYEVKETCIPGDEHTSTLISAGAVLLASVLVSSRDAHLLSELTGFPVGFTAAVLLVQETSNLYFSVSYADLINAVRRHPEDLDRIEDAINQVMGEYWETMEKHWPATLNVLRARHLVGGTQQDWSQDEEEFGTFDDEEILLVN